METTQEYHGLSLNPNDTTKLTITRDSSGNGINIFHSFARELGCTVNPSTKVNLSEMISNLPEIHELTYNLGLLNTSKRKFLPISIDYISNNLRWTRLGYQIQFSKRHKNNYRAEKFKTGILSRKLDEIEDDNEIYRSKLIKNITHTSNTSWCSNYDELCNEIKSLGVHVMLTRQGYKYYLDLQKDKFTPIIYRFILMFYVGSVARYRPSLNEEILEGQYKAIISEIMKSSPKQFLYHITGLITKKICAIPMANLD